jgi:chromosome segregation ATPase
VTDSHAESLLAAAAELEARDERIGAELAELAELAARAARVDERARELVVFLEAVPAELAALDGQREILQRRLEQARAQEAAAAQRLVELEGARRAQARRVQAERERDQAGEAAEDASRGLERLQERRDKLLGEESSAHTEADALADEAREVAAEVRRQSRVSASGRGEPGLGLAGLTAWADRVQAALLVARSGLDSERERLVREANELGSAVLGEPLGGSSVTVVRRRLERALRGGPGSD